MRLRVCLMLASSLVALATGENIFGLRKEVTAHGFKGNPGLLLRISPEAFRVLAPVVSHMIDEQVLSLRRQQMTTELRNGEVTIKNIALQAYRRPTHVDFTLQNFPMRILRLEVNGTSLNAVGDCYIRMRIIKLDSPIMVMLHGLSTVLGLGFRRTPRGQVTASLEMCEVDVFDLDFDIQEPGVFGPLLRLMRRRINAQIFDSIRSYVCTTLQELVERNLNSYLAMLPTDVPLLADEQEAERGKGKRNGDSDSAIDAFLNVPGLRYTSSKKLALLQSLLLDLRLVGDPLITPDFAETAHVGEITFDGQNPVPFSPKPMWIASYRQKRPFTIIASDFVVNSLLYSLYRQNVLNLNFHPHFAPELADLLKVPCGGAGTCLGAALPTFHKAFPGHHAAVYFQPVLAPAVLFLNDRVDFLSDGLMRVFAKKGNASHELLTVSLKMRLAARLSIRGERIVGNVSTINYTATVVHKHLPLDQAKFALLTRISKHVLLSTMNQSLRRGYRIPNMVDCQLTSPVMTIVPNTAIIESDIDLPFASIEAMVKSFLSN